MNVETFETEDGIEIQVHTGRKIAVVVQGDEERIYLPDVNGDDSSYYLEEPDQLLKTEYGYKVLHRGTAENIQILG